jgi:hypothetical protein
MNSEIHLISRARYRRVGLHGFTWNLRVAGTTDGSTKFDMAEHPWASSYFTRHLETTGSHPECAEHLADEHVCLHFSGAPFLDATVPHLPRHVEAVQVRFPQSPFQLDLARRGCFPLEPHLWAVRTSTANGVALGYQAALECCSMLAKSFWNTVSGLEVRG